TPGDVVSFLPWVKGCSGGRWALSAPRRGQLADAVRRTFNRSPHPRRLLPARSRGKDGSHGTPAAPTRPPLPVHPKDDGHSSSDAPQREQMGNDEAPDTGAPATRRTAGSVSTSPTRCNSESAPTLAPRASR